MNRDLYNEIFARRPMGGGAPRKRPAAAPADAGDPEPLAHASDDQEASKEATEKAVLSNPTWVLPETQFHEETEVSVQLTLPAAKKNLTRVEVELHAQTPEGPKFVVKAEGNAGEDGKAVVKLPVYQPTGYSGGPVDYFLIFKHKLAEALNADNLQRRVSEFALKSADHELIPGLAFPKNSSFIHPQAAGELKTLENKLKEWDGRSSSGKVQIVVFGHAGKEEKEPKSLSDRRAQSTFAFITNDAGTWEKLYQTEKWGLISLQILLKDLGHYAGKADGSDGPKTQAAFKALQKKSSLPETGQEDAATRKALFAAYMKGKHDIRLDASRFRKVAGNPWMGCGALNAAKTGGTPAPENRRVTFILLRESRFFPIHFPCQDGNEKGCTAQCQRKGKRSAEGIQCLFYDELVREKTQSAGGKEEASLAVTLSEAQLKAISGATDTLVKKYQGDMNTLMKEKNLDTALRKAHFLAQVCAESGCLKYSEELASGEDYEGRNDLGNTEKGDGKLFKGRGLIQITGRSNYSTYGTFCGEDMTTGDNPKKVAEPKHAVLSAIWYWTSRSLNDHADKDDFLQVTFRVNGGFNGIHHRAKYLKKGYEEFEVPDIEKRVKGFCDTISANLDKVDPLVKAEQKVDKDLTTTAAAKKLHKDKKISLFERLLFVAIDSKTALNSFKAELGI